MCRATWYELYAELERETAQQHVVMLLVDRSKFSRSFDRDKADQSSRDTSYPKCDSCSSECFSLVSCTDVFFQ
jgi:hypothetical protein